MILKWVGERFIESTNRGATTSIFAENDSANSLHAIIVCPAPVPRLTSAMRQQSTPL